MMKKLFALLLAFALSFTMFAFASCKDGGGTVCGGGPQPPVMSEYEIFKENNPAYRGDERKYNKDNAAGRLEKEYSYEIVSEDYIAGDTFMGELTFDGSVKLKDGVVVFEKPVIMPAASDGEWEINISGVLSEVNASAELLTSSEEIENGRIYFGVYAEKNIAYMGANIGGYYFNYCWNVQGDIIKSDHEYTLKYKDGLYTLSVDGGEEEGFASLNVNQGNSVKVTSPEVASNDLTEKIKAISGQEYFTLVSIGAKSHKCTCAINSLKIKTSAIFNYESLTEHPLCDKTIYHLGSSISYGQANNGISFADQIADLTESKCVKMTVSGTPLANVNNRGDSYAERFEMFDFDDDPEFLVLQLSTNDFSQGIKAGTLSYDFDRENIKPDTITGAIEYIIAYTKEMNPKTKVILYVCYVKDNWGKRAEYASFVDNQLKEIQEKWEISVVDLLGKQTVKTEWMADEIHPNGAQYANLFAPALINEMVNLLKK